MKRIERILEQSKKYSYPTLSKNKIKSVEKLLSFKFSDEFKVISQRSNYEYFDACGYEFLNFSRLDSYSIVYETKKLRDICGLPENYIVLSIMDDVNIILLENNLNNTVINCSMEDFDNLCTSGNFLNDPIIYPSFTDFFEYLLEQEELERSQSN